MTMVWMVLLVVDVIRLLEMMVAWRSITGDTTHHPCAGHLSHLGSSTLSIVSAPPPPLKSRPGLGVFGISRGVSPCVPIYIYI